MPRVSVGHVEPNSHPSPVVVSPLPPIPPPVLPVSEVDNELKHKSNGSMLSAFSAYPAGVSFSGEDPDEEIILLLRAHLVTNVPWALATLGGFFVPLLVLPFLSSLEILPGIGFGTGLVITLFWYLGLATYAFLNFLFWYFNVGIITNERVVDIDWNSLTHREITFALISKIQDVTPKQIGVLAGIFDLGSVYVQTAGTEPNIEFLNIPHPQLVAQKIQGLLQKEEQEWEHP